MKFIIEPINETECRIVDIDCSGMQGEKVSELTFPSQVEQDGKAFQVKEVGRRACWANKTDSDAAKFASLGKLKKIIFSEGIESVEGVMEPFNNSNAEGRGNCETLEEVVFPSSLKKIGNHSFLSCKVLGKATLPDTLEEIGARAFCYCEHLPLPQWPKSLKRIDISAFANVPAPEDEEGHSTYVLEIPDTIEAIEGKSSYLAKIHKCIVSAKAWDVLDRSNLTECIINMDIPEGATKILGNYSYSARRISLPSTIEEVGEGVFAQTHVLDYISELPSSLRTVGKRAFASCWHGDSIKELRINSPEIKVGSSAFDNDGKIRLVGEASIINRLMGQPGALNGTAIEEIDIPEGADEIEISDCPQLRKLTIPNTVTKITEIFRCPKLENFEIPSSVEEIVLIGSCRSLTRLFIPNSVTTIHEIKELDSLEELSLPDGLQNLYHIKEVGNVKKIVLPDTIQHFTDPSSKYASDCFDRINADIVASPKIWKLLCDKASAFASYNPPSGEVVIPEGVESLARNLFTGKFKTVKLPASLITIGQNAFSSCSELEMIELPEGSRLEEIGAEAFAQTALKEVRLPDGFKKLGAQVFKDMEKLENVTFPASISDFSFQTDRWGNVTTPFLRCKNLKYVVFLAEDPATAVYPPALGKLCDWYVPDSMVDHVKAFLEKAKAEYPELKGIGAKSVKPLSKLKGGGAPAPKKAPTKKQQAYTQPIQLKAFGISMVYSFPLREEDINLVKSELDVAILFAKYMRDRISDCSLNIIDSRPRGNSWTVEEIKLETKVDSATAKEWHSTGKSVVRLDYSDLASLPEDFPAAKAPEVAKAGSFSALFAEKCQQYRRDLPAGASLYLRGRLAVNIVFDFKIGEKEKFNVKKLTVMPDWDSDRKSKNCWRFALLYNGRYIPASKVVSQEGDENYNIRWSIDISKSPDFSDTEKLSSNTTDGVEFRPVAFYAAELPLVAEILSLMK